MNTLTSQISLYKSNNLTSNLPLILLMIFVKNKN